MAGSPSRWDFLNTFNTTAFKGWSVGWLWIYTGAVWGIALILCKTPSSEFLGVWLGGLTLYSGVSAYQYGTMRNTDYGALERKANATQPTNVSVTASQAQVNAPTGESKP